MPSAPPASRRCAANFEPLAPGGVHVPNTNSYRWPEDRDPLWAADQIEERILFEGPETVAAVILEPLQNAGGCIPPQEGYFQRVREICDRYDVLLISDEVICAWGRLGHYFGCQRYGYQPDIVTVAKALTSAYVPMGGMIVSDRVFEPFAEGTAIVRARLDLRRAIRSRRPPRWRTSTSSSARTSAATSWRRRPSSGRRSSPSTTSRSSATCAATATSWRSSWSRTRTPRSHMEDEESEKLLRGYLSGELYRRGLICRADDRGDPVVQLAPPLIADTEQFEEIVEVLRPVLEEAARRVGH